MKDKRFFQLAKALEKATQAELDILVNEVNAVFNKYTESGQITDTVMLNKEIGKLVDNYYNQFVEDLKISSREIANLQARNAMMGIIPLLTKAGLYKEGIELYKYVNAYADSVAKRLMVNGWAGQPLSYTIKTIKAGTQKTVQNIVINGVSQGRGSKAIAKDLEQYIRPIANITTTKPYDEYRKRFGRPKSFTPKGVPAGSVQFNALRIARTESAHIYREATLDFYDGKPYNKGFSWNLSNRHPDLDICDEYAQTIYKTRDEIPVQHPNCLCAIQSVPMTYNELRSYQKLKYGDKAKFKEKISVTRER